MIRSVFPICGAKACAKEELCGKPSNKNEKIHMQTEIMIWSQFSTDSSVKFRLAQFEHNDDVFAGNHDEFCCMNGNGRTRKLLVRLAIQVKRRSLSPYATGVDRKTRII